MNLMAFIYGSPLTNGTVFWAAEPHELRGVRLVTLLDVCDVLGGTNLQFLSRL